MKSCTLALAILTLSLFACSTTTNHRESAVQDTAAYESFRAPASSGEYEQYDTQFEALMALPLPQAKAALVKNFDHVIDAYVYAEEQLYQFDQELDAVFIDAGGYDGQGTTFSGKKISPMTYSKTYSHLLAARATLSSLNEKIAYFTFKFLEYSLNKDPFFTAADFGNDADAYHRAVANYSAWHSLSTALYVAALNEIHVGISQNVEDQIREVAFHDIRTLMNSTHRQYREELKNKGKDPTTENDDFQSIDIERAPVGMFKTEEDFEKFAGTPDFKLNVLNRSQTKPIDPDLKKNLEKHAKDIYSELQKQKKDLARSPQSGAEVYYPSMDSHGNITGSTFPNGTWALTYDDGPHTTYTLQDVANLKAHNFRATFFWLAQNVKLAEPPQGKDTATSLHYQNILRTVQASNFPHNNHSWTHPELSKMNETQLHHEIDEAEALEVKDYNAYGGNTDKTIQDGPDLTPRFFRAPYGDGANKPAVRTHIVANHLIHVFWNVDTLDWQDHNPDSILARATKQITLLKHGVILFHDIHPQSVAASDKLMTWFRNTKMKTDKVRLVTLPDIVDEMNGKIVNGQAFSAGPYSVPTGAPVAPAAPVHPAPGSN